MLRATVLLFVTCLNIGLSHSMECSNRDGNIFDKIISTSSCPGSFDSEDKVFCCYDIETRRNYCCNATEFGITESWILVTMIVLVVVGVSLITFCVSCLCCSCCPWHRRRHHRGTVYGRVHAPSSVVHVIQTPANVADAPYYTNTSNPTNSTGIMQPPPYTPSENNMYAKQAPYNPNCV